MAPGGSGIQSTFTRGRLARLMIWLLLILPVASLDNTMAGERQGLNETGKVRTRELGQSPIMVIGGTAPLDRTAQAAVIDSLAPARLIAGGSATTLTVRGRFFVNGAVVRINGTSRTTTFVNSGELTTLLATSDLLAAGTLTVTVANPGSPDSVSVSLPVFRRTTSVSAASYAVGEQARDSILAAFGTGLASGVEVSSSRPLPTTLRGTRVVVTDSAGVSRDQPLFFVSPGQVNYHLHPATAVGAATVAIYLNSDIVALGELLVGNLAPAIFTQNASGEGVPAAYGLQVVGSSTRLVDLFNYNSSLSRWEARPINPGTPSQPVYLALFGTGFRAASGVAAVTAKIGATNIPVQYIGATTDFVGLDQLNIGPLPSSLLGTGTLSLQISIEGRTTNQTQLKFLQTLALNAEWRAPNGPYGGRFSRLLLSGGSILAGSYDNGIFRSTNNGESWTAVNNNNYNLTVYSMVNHNGKVFVGGYGVDISSDNGQSWTQFDNSIKGKVVQALLSSGNNLYAGTYDFGRSEGTVYVTSDNGATWTNLDLRLSQRAVIALASTPGNLFAGTSGNGILRSTNNGLTWSPVNDGLTSLVVTQLVTSGPNIFAGTERGLLVSSNNGQNWSQVSAELSEQIITSLHANGNDLFAGTNSGRIYLSTNNGLTWTQVSSGLPPFPVYGILGVENSIFAATFGAGIHRSSNRGAAWNSAAQGLTAIVFKSLIVNGENLLLGTGGTGLYTSINRGQSWTQLPPLTDVFFDALAGDGTTYYAGSSGLIFKSSNGGASWVVASTGLASDNVTVIRQVNSSVFAGTYNNGVYVSSNGGGTWAAANNGLTNRSITSFSVIGTNIFAGTTGGGVFLSTNNGASWIAVNNGLTTQFVTSLEVSGTSLFAGTDKGVFVSTNNGESWRPFNTGLFNPYVLALAASNGNILASLSGQGVFISYADAPFWSPINRGLTGEAPVALVADARGLFALVGSAGVFTINY